MSSQMEMSQYQAMSREQELLKELERLKQERQQQLEDAGMTEEELTKLPASQVWLAGQKNVGPGWPPTSPPLAHKISDRVKKVPFDDEGYPKSSLLWKLRMVRKNSITFQLCNTCAENIDRYMNSHANDMGMYLTLCVPLCMKCAEVNMITAECNLVVKQMKDAAINEALPAQGCRIWLRTLAAPSKNPSLTIRMCRKCDEINYKHRAELECSLGALEGTDQKIIKVPILLCQKCCFENMVVTETLDPSM